RPELPGPAGAREALAAEAARLPPRARDRRPRPSALRRRAPATRAAALGAARVPSGRRGGGAGRGRRGAVREGKPVAHVLASRPARAALPQEPERALPPWALPPLARQRKEG